MKTFATTFHKYKLQRISGDPDAAAGHTYPVGHERFFLEPFRAKLMKNPIPVAAPKVQFSSKA